MKFVDTAAGRRAGHSSSAKRRGTARSPLYPRRCSHPQSPGARAQDLRSPGEMGRSRRRCRGAGRGAAARQGLPGEHRPPPGGGVSSLRLGNGTGPSADGGALLQTAPAMRLRAARSGFKATPCRGWGERRGPPAAAPARRASRGATLSGEGASAEPARSGEEATQAGKRGKDERGQAQPAAETSTLEGGGFPVPGQPLLFPPKVGFF